MKNIIWDDSLSVDVEEIDDDHRKLVDLFNILIHSIMEGDPTDYIEAVLDELISCTEWHFKHEERLMLKYQYPQIEEHKTEHHDLIDSIKRLQSDIQKENIILSDKEVEYLSSWLTGHILGHDMKLGFYLMDAM